MIPAEPVSVTYRFPLFVALRDRNPPNVTDRPTDRQTDQQTLLLTYRANN